MAGGMSRGARYQPQPSRTAVTPKHCWVVNPPGAPGRWPGLLLEWRRAENGEWEGRVAYVAQLQNGHALMELWLPGAFLAPTH
jgi:hypothetical protein